MKHFLLRIFKPATWRQQLIKDYELNQQCRSADIWEDLQDQSRLATETVAQLGRLRRGDPELFRLLTQMDEIILRLNLAFEHYKTQHVR